MRKIDDVLDENSHSKEDEERLREVGDEPDYARQAVGLFRGPMGWVMWVMVIAQIVLLGNAGYALWNLYETDDPLAAMRWAVVAVVLVQIITFLRGFMGTHFEANRVLREIRRLEVRMMRIEDKLDQKGSD
jgi:hypothetical protein